MKKTSTTSATATHATPKSTKWEQLAKCHTTTEVYKNEVGEVVLTDELLRELAAGQRYSYKGKSIHVTEKITNFGTGGHTVLTGTIDGEPFDKLNIEKIKYLVGCDFRRAKSGSSNDKTAAGKLYYLLSKAEIIAFAEGCKDKQILATLMQLRGLAGAEKKAEDAERERAKAEADAKDKRAKEIARLITQTAKTLNLSEADAKALLKL